MISQNEILSCINDSLGFLLNDFSHAAIIRVLKFSEIQTNLFEKEQVNNKSFNHIFISINPDTFDGRIILIPIAIERNFKAENNYLMCEVRS